MNPETRTNKTGQFAALPHSPPTPYRRPKKTTELAAIWQPCNFEQAKQCRRTTRYATVSVEYGRTVGVTAVKNLAVGNYVF
jgi:hypothetical protein